MHVADEVIDGVACAHIDMLTGAPETALTDFNLTFKRDIILCKLVASDC